MSDKDFDIKEILGSLATALDKHGLKEASEGIKEVESAWQAEQMMSRTHRTTGLPSSTPMPSMGGPTQIGEDQEWTGQGWIDRKLMPLFTDIINKTKGSPKDIEKLIGMLQNSLKEKQQTSIHASCAVYLDKLSGDIRAVGYDKLSERVASVSRDCYLKYAGVKDLHEIPSLEELYQRSKEPKQFEEDVKKIIDVYQKVLDVLKRFDERYKTEMLSAIERIDTETAVEKTVKMVREADHFVEIEINKIKSK